VRSENFLLLAAAAEKFGCRPSQMVELRDPVLALDFDLAAAARLVQRERAASSAGLQPGNGPEAGTAPVHEERW
jgi:hypothetical protein